MITPDLNQIKEYALSGKYKTVPVSMEILSDIKTPLRYYVFYRMFRDIAICLNLSPEMNSGADIRF